MGRLDSCQHAAYVQVDFKRGQTGEGVVERIEYDPNRSARIALVRYAASEQPDTIQRPKMAYILAPQQVSAGDRLIASPTAGIRIGNTLPLSYIPVGQAVRACNLTLVCLRLACVPPGPFAWLCP